MKIFENNLEIRANSFFKLDGLLKQSKDGRLLLKSINLNREKQIFLDIKGFTSPSKAKRLLELLSILLIDDQGFLRDIETIDFNKKEDSISININ
jgi:hypothetical protein